MKNINQPTRHQKLKQCFMLIRLCFMIFLVLVICHKTLFGKAENHLFNQMDLVEFAKKYDCQLNIYQFNQYIILSKGNLEIHWLWDSTIAMTNKDKFIIFDKPILREKNRFILNKEWIDKLKNQFEHSQPEQKLSDLKHQTKSVKSKKFIAIDPGHGGQYPGNVHYKIKEKDLTLILAKQIASQLKKKMPEYHVFLTRTKDEYLSLEERAEKAMALRIKGQNGVFISIHANGSINKQAQGIETFFYSTQSADLDSLRKKSIQPLIKQYEPSKKSVKTILTKMVDTLLSETSFQLAKSVNKMLYQKIKAYTVNRGIKTHHFFVIKNINLPSILVEIGFLSHRTEAKRLKNKKYQHLITDGIVNGIISYMQSQ